MHNINVKHSIPNNFSSSAQNRGEFNTNSNNSNINDNSKTNRKKKSSKEKKNISSKKSHDGIDGDDSTSFIFLFFL